MTLTAQSREPAGTDHLLIKSAILSAISNRTIVELEPRTYVLNEKISLAFNHPVHIRIRGVRGKTKIVVRDGFVQGRWHGAIQIVTKGKAAASSTFGIDGVSVSTNASGNPRPKNAGRNVFEQASAIKILGPWALISITNCESFDCVADGFHVGGDRVGKVIVKNLMGRDRDLVKHARSCFSFTFNQWDEVLLENVDVVRIDFEPNNGDDSETENRIKVQNLRTHAFDFGGQGKLSIDGLVVTETMHLGSFTTLISNFDITLRKPFRPVRGRHVFKNGTFRVSHEFPAKSKSVKSLIYSTGAKWNAQPELLIFDNVDFQKGTGQNPAYCFAALAQLDEYVEFKNCTSDIPLADLSRKGDVRIINE